MPSSTPRQRQRQIGHAQDGLPPRPASAYWQNSSGWPGLTGLASRDAGDIYSGEWSKGKKHGEGTYFAKLTSTKLKGASSATTLTQP